MGCSNFQFLSHIINNTETANFIIKTLTRIIGIFKHLITVASITIDVKYACQI